MSGKHVQKKIYFIDSRVENLRLLLDSLDDSAAWYVLDANVDGVVQIQKILSSYHDLDSIQIVSHGSSGAINIGNATLNGASLIHYKSQLEDIGSALTKGGDILLYGCNVSKDVEGLKFVNDLATLTGADVAASNDQTGFGGNVIA